MPRYIDAELIDSPEMERKLINCDYHELKKDLELFPTADVEEVRHGEIIKSGRRYPYCSECKCNVSDGFYRCPWCGAKFDGRKEK